MSRRNARLLQLLGIVIALAGLAGYWLTRDVQRTILSEGQAQVLGIEEGTEPLSFVVAGRDFNWVSQASPCVWRNGVCNRASTGEFVYSKRTDTILYVSIIGDQITMVNIPRDVYLPKWQTKINSMYAYQGAEGLMDTVGEIVGLPIDYYAIINMEIFKNIVDAIGGVDIYIPYDMYYHDAAAGLTIDFDEGLTHLDGEAAEKFVRYRNTARSDIDRIDNLKRLAYAVLAKLKQENIRAAGRIPAILGTFFEDVETNATLSVMTDLVPRIAEFEISSVTLPVCCARRVDGQAVLGYHPAEVEEVLAQVFGGEARDLTTPPEATVLITNRSGLSGLGQQVREQLLALGVPEESVLTREGELSPSPTRIETTAAHWQDATYYASLFHVGQQQVDSLPEVDGIPVHLEIILGDNAASYALAPDTSLAQGGDPD